MVDKNSPRSHSGVEGQSRSEPRRASTGLRPSQLLALSEAERRLIRHLSRYVQADLEALQLALPDLSPPALGAAVASLKEAGYVRRVFVAGKIQYRVAWGWVFHQDRRSLPQRIWDLLKLDTMDSLRQALLFRGLPDAELQKIARKMEVRRYARNEVIIWQGEVSDQVFVIKNGLVSITHRPPGSEKNHLLAYLREGDILGAVGVLKDQTRSATAIALSAVEALAMQKSDFLAMLQRCHSVTLELARVLSQELVATNIRLGASQAEPHLVLLFGISSAAGRTLIGEALAATLARKTGQPTAYTEYPASRDLAARFGFLPDEKPYRHPGGYDLFLPKSEPTLSPTVQAILMLDDLLGRYTNVVISLPGRLEGGVSYMLERAGQIILIAPPSMKAWKSLAQFSAELKKRLQPGKTDLFTLINRSRPKYRNAPAPGEADFDLPYLPALPPLPSSLQGEFSLPEPWSAAIEALVDSLGRTHQIAIYIPTTIDVDQSFDTGPYVEKTLAFLSERFGGATSSDAQGVWEGDEAGLVRETVHIVRSYVTRADLNAHLDAIFAYVEDLKVALMQEAMAVEVDQKLMLV